MTGKQDEFLKRLRATFKVKAAALELGLISAEEA